jgi:hypothetical protein
MALQYPLPNHRSANEYMMSGLPFVTSSVSATEVPVKTGTPLQVKFPSLTRWVAITNTGGEPLRVGFTANGVKSHGADGGSYNVTGSGGRYFVVPENGSGTPGGTVRLELKCMSVFFLSDTATATGFSLAAGLTGIAETQFVNLTGSQGFQGIG